MDDLNEYIGREVTVSFKFYNKEGQLIFGEIKGELAFDEKEKEWYLQEVNYITFKSYESTRLLNNRLIINVEGR